MVTSLAPQARIYLQPGHENLPGLQLWLDQLAASGQASSPPQYIGDSPAAALVPGQPLYVLSPQSVVPAHSPLEAGSRVGQTYTPPNDASRTALRHALAAQLNGGALFATTAQGNVSMAVPVPQAVYSDTVVGVVIVTIAPLPDTLWTRVWPSVQRLAPAAVLTVLGTAGVLLIAVAPLGALFGLVMSRGLTRRLAALSTAADAWSEGNFTPAAARARRG